MYLLVILFVIIITCLIPMIVVRVLRYFPNITLHSAPGWLPVLAAGLFFIAFYIPDIHISDQTTTFQQHFVGGGMYVACLYVYFKKLFGWKLQWLVALILLFAWASTFGVANELLEFALTQLHLARIGTGDTDWDLLANTLGAFAGYGLLILSGVERDSTKGHSSS